VIGGSPKGLRMIGKTLAHYEILSKLGEGGMGEVWKARDTNLDREVAIKILPEAYTADTDRLLRFEREAKLLASLNHPNIATVYGLHEANGVHFIAMELVPGTTLATRLARGVVQVSEVLEMARQVIDALEAAHERGVIHRDLKPANIMIRGDGTVKVLDFGLAKSPGPSSAAADDSTAATVVLDRTREGVILGTSAYMSPEQARGQPLDKRTDIWSFGCVLYEMLTARRCFDGGTSSDVLARVLEGEPDWSGLPVKVPAELRRLLDRCLRKNPAERLRDIGDARILLEDLRAGDEMAATTATPRLRHNALRLAVTALAVACAAVLGWMIRKPAPSDPRSPTRLVVGLPEQHQLAIALDFSLAISPDGSALVYGASSSAGQPPRLYLRRLDDFKATPIPGTEGAFGPFFSPDSRMLGFITDAKLYTIAVDGGTPVEICQLEQAFPGACWGTDGWIYFVHSLGRGLSRIPAEGGTPEVLTSPDATRGETAHGWPHLLPDEEHLLFTIQGVGGSRIAVLSLQTGQWRTIEKAIGAARYLSSGHLLFARSEGLTATGFDLERLEATSAPVVVLEGIYRMPGMYGVGLAAYSVADDGRLVYLAADATASQNRLVWVDRDGQTRHLGVEPTAYEWPRISPDSSRVAVTERTADGKLDVWVLDFARQARTRLTLHGNGILPCWTPDGKEIMFGMPKANSSMVAIYGTAADGSGQPRLILEGSNPRFPITWSPVGRQLAFVEWHPRNMRDIWIYSESAQPQAEPFVATPFDEYAPKFSPDGRWLAYVSNESGRYDVYVKPFPDGRGRWLVSVGGGTEPAWAPDGQVLFYRNGNDMMEVQVRTEPTLAVDPPTVVFTKAFKTGVFGTLSYDVSADGRRFLMIERNLEMIPNHLNVVLDWGAELQQRVPVTPN
jgi:Tol biopolymer transport system component/tRNA A-37 threonylcarbamoyl transferase component Bud32